MVFLFLMMFFYEGQAYTYAQVKKICFSSQSKLCFWLGHCVVPCIEFIKVGQEFIDRRVFSQGFVAPSAMCLWGEVLFVYDQGRIFEVDRMGQIQSVFSCSSKLNQVTSLKTFDGETFYLISVEEGKVFVWNKSCVKIVDEGSLSKGIWSPFDIIEFKQGVVLTSLSQGLIWYASEEGDNRRCSQTPACLSFITRSPSFNCFFVGEYELMQEPTSSRPLSFWSRLIERVWGEAELLIPSKTKKLSGRFRIRLYNDYLYQYQVSSWIKGDLKGVIAISDTQCVIVYWDGKRYKFEEQSSDSWQQEREVSLIA